MDATAQLRQDHEELRARFALLEALLPLEEMGSEALRKLADGVSRHLRQHVETEECVVAGLLGGVTRLEPADLAWLIARHQEDRAELDRFCERLCTCGPASQAELLPCGCRCLQALRQALAREEAQLFPLLEQCAAQDSRHPIAA